MAFRAISTTQTSSVRSLREDIFGMPVDLPKKLKEDAIVEALLEIRFESDDIGEIVVGRLNDLEIWKDLPTQRLSNADIPEFIRDNDNRLRFSPVIERRSDEFAVRIGSKVLSLHVYAPYPGWDELQDKLAHVIKELFAKLDNLRIVRLGLRYINLIESDRHKTEGINDLDLSLQVENEDISDGLNVSYRRKPSDKHIVLTRVASPDFINASDLPEDVVAVIDVDVFTPTGYEESEQAEVHQWLFDAHLFEKQAFFQLLPDELVEELLEE